MSGSKSSNPVAAEAQPPLSALSQPLGLTVHSLPSPDPALLARQRATGRLKMLLVLLVCAAPVAASYFMAYVVRPSGQGVAYSALINPPVAAPDVQGLGLDGQPRRLRALAGQWLLVVAHGGVCDKPCEERLFMQRQLREMTGRERDRVDKLWLVLDDAPLAPALQAALQATPGMQILRLPRSTVAAWLQPAPGQALEDHLYIVDPLGQWMMRAPAAADPSKLKRDVDRLLRASAGWDQPGRQALIEGAPAAPAPAPAAASAKVP